ncbi:hypothetical protein [Providencia heimbachae]|uniref:Uncharacterized protein n=1 Tax=Providencia heimbachae ATCC 35613 TaxID=1354272 RepID=A0A1B7K1J6_9GAMM|nr:hypothetical protein [Providencia heimbachae]OAT54018.1 hypothetical protein M998_0699 [Providencia heimbachae ATCC 35613]SQH13757.1 Uncharacterised protein [Providencia heimbachae]
MIEQDNAENEMVDYDDTTIRSTHYVDDGRDYTARIIHRIRQRCYIRMGICPPTPPAPQVVAPKLMPNTKKKKRAKKVNDERN